MLPPIPPLQFSVLLLKNSRCSTLDLSHQSISSFSLSSKQNDIWSELRRAVRSMFLIVHIL
jgi:hypothetical protein